MILTIKLKKFPNLNFTFTKKNLHYLMCNKRILQQCNDKIYWHYKDCKKKKKKKVWTESAHLHLYAVYSLRIKTTTVFLPVCFFEFLASAPLCAQFHLFSHHRIVFVHRFAELLDKLTQRIAVVVEFWWFWRFIEWHTLVNTLTTNKVIIE